MAIEYGRTELGLPAKREQVILKNGKSDIITKKYLGLCQKYCDKKEFEKAIRVANRAYFSALSEQAKFDALKKRCYILLQMEYHAEFLKDAISCLEVNSYSNLILLLLNMIAIHGIICDEYANQTSMEELGPLGRSELPLIIMSLAESEDYGHDDRFLSLLHF